MPHKPRNFASHSLEELDKLETEMQRRGLTLIEELRLIATIRAQREKVLIFIMERRGSSVVKVQDVLDELEKEFDIAPGEYGEVVGLAVARELARKREIERCKAGRFWSEGAGNTA